MRRLQRAVACWRAFVARSALLSSLIAALCWAVIAAATLRPARGLPYWKLVVPMTTFQGDLIGALPLISSFLALQLWVGSLEMRRSRRQVIALMVAASAVIQALQGLASSALELMVASAFVGFAPIEPLLESMVQDQPLSDHDKNVRRLIVGLAFTGFLALLDAGSPAAMQLLGVRWAFWGGALVSAPVAVLAWLSLPDPPPQRRVVGRPRRRTTEADRLQLWYALVNGTDYAVMTAPLALVLEHYHVLALLWVFGFRRLVPVVTSWAWSKVATRPDPSTKPGTDSFRVYRPAAPIVASALMQAPFMLWLWVALHVRLHVVWWLFAAWATLEITRGFGQTTQRGLPKQDRATFGRMVARTVLGIAIGTYLGLLAFSFWGSTVVIGIGIGLVIIEVAIAAPLAMLLVTERIIDEGSFIGQARELEIDCQPRGPSVTLEGAMRPHRLGGRTLEWVDTDGAPVLTVQFMRVSGLTAARHRRRPPASRSGGSHRVLIGPRDLVRVSGHGLHFNVLVDVDQVRVVLIAAWHDDHTPRQLGEIAGWRLTPSRPGLRSLADALRALGGQRVA